MIICMGIVNDFPFRRPYGYFNYISKAYRKRIITSSGNAGNGKNGNCVPFFINIITIYYFTYYFSITKTILPSVPPPE